MGCARVSVSVLMGCARMRVLELNIVRRRKVRNG